jgi:hypothetical protein
VVEKFVGAMEEARLGRKPGDQAMALVGHAGTALGGGEIGILHCGRLTGNQGVLSVVDGMGIGVGKAQVKLRGPCGDSLRAWLRCRGWRQRPGIR